eukprot:sb/3463544/
MNNSIISVQQIRWVSKQPIRTCYLGHVTVYQPIRDQYFLIRLVSEHRPNELQLVNVPNVLKCTYTLNKVDYADNGRFTCTGYNNITGGATQQTDTSTLDITITEDVQVTLSASTTVAVGNEMEATFGETVTVTCVAEGGRTPHYMELTKDDIPLVIYNTDDTNSNILADKVVATDNKLTLTYEISSIGFDSNGDYECESKNKAFNKTVASDSQELEIVVVQDVKIGTLKNLEVDFDGSVSLNFTVTGGRPPKSVKVTKTPHTILDWPNNIGDCSGDNVLQCSVTITAEDWSYNGEYTVVAKNDASQMDVEDTKQFGVTVFMDVETDIAISESDPAKIKYGKDLTITCTAEGGKEPHSLITSHVTLITSSDWFFTCVGLFLNHTPLQITCTHILASPGYTSDGSYTCTGYNVVSDGGDVNSTETIQLTIGKFYLKSEMIFQIPTSITTGSTQIQYVRLSVRSSIIVSRRFNEPSSFEGQASDFLLALKLSIPQIKWQYPNGTEVDHDSMVVYRALDSHTWTAELTLTTPHKEAEGAYKCVGDGVGTSVTVTIAGNRIRKY